MQDKLTGTQYRTFEKPSIAELNTMQRTVIEKVASTGNFMVLAPTDQAKPWLF